MAQASSDKSWLEEFVEGKRILLIVDSRDQGELELHDIRRVLNERPDIEIAYNRKDSIELRNGGWIFFLTPRQANSGRGTRLDRIVELQTDPLPEKAWFALKPCLAAG